MKLSELIEQLKTAHKDMNTEAHTSICDGITILDEDANFYKIEKVEWDQAIGCQCTIGATLHIKKD